MDYYCTKCNENISEDELVDIQVSAETREEPAAWLTIAPCCGAPLEELAEIDEEVAA